MSTLWIGITFAIVGLLILLQYDRISAYLGKLFFRSGHIKGKPSKYVCPMCGSTNWKFPNPLKSATMVNIPQMVHLLRECRECGHVGIFFVMDEKDPVKFSKNVAQPQISVEEGMEDGSLLLNPILICVFVVLAFLSMELFAAVILVGIGTKLIRLGTRMLKQRR